MPSSRGSNHGSEPAPSYPLRCIESRARSSTGATSGKKPHRAGREEPRGGGLLLPAMAMSTAEAGGGAGGNKRHTNANRNTLVVAGCAPMRSTAGDTSRQRLHRTRRRGWRSSPRPRWASTPTASIVRKWRLPRRPCAEGWHLPIFEKLDTVYRSVSRFTDFVTDIGKSQTLLFNLQCVTKIRPSTSHTIAHRPPARTVLNVRAVPASPCRSRCESTWRAI